MDFANGTYEILHEDSTAVVTSNEKSNGLDHHDLESAMHSLEETLRQWPATNIVVDCGNTDSFGCSTIGLFARLRKLAKGHGGKFALCGLAPAQLEMLQVAKLDSLWPIFFSRAEAMEEVASGGHGEAGRTS